MSIRFFICIILIVLLSFLSCAKKEQLEQNFNQSLSQISVCRNTPKIPEGKGKLFQTTKEDAIKLVQKEYESENKKVSIRNQAIICQTTFFWKIVFEEERVIYVISKVSGKLILKIPFPDMSSNSEKADDKVFCKDAIQIAESNYIKKITSLGYSEQEAIEHRKDFYVLICELKNSWLVTFEFEFFNLSDFNNENDLQALPNLHTPTYIIDKKTGESLLLSD